MPFSPEAAAHGREALAERIAALLAPRAEILEAYLFGSQATCRAQPHSDIDVAVYVEEAGAVHSGYGYPAELTTVLMAGLRTNQVDVVVLNHAPPVLYHRVLRDGIRVLSRDLRATTTREGYALSRYCDYVPQLAKIEAAMRAARQMTAGRPDPQIVRRHLAALREALANLKRHGSLTATELAASSDSRWIVERGLELCAQNVLDVATHIAASSGFDAPDHASAIDRLAELGALPADFAAQLRGIAGFRDVLVHGYLKVDLAVLENALRDKIPQLEQFAGFIEDHLPKIGG